MSAPSGLRVTRRKRLISVFGEGSRQSKELAKDLTSDNQRLCDSTGLEPITFRLLVGLCPLSAEKKKNTHFLVSVWSGLRGSNPPPPPWQGGALPNELNPRKWCLRSESNQRHEDFQSSALPTELQRHIGWRLGWGSNPRPLA